VRTYKLMISHAWRYGDDYYRLLELLEGVPDFIWRNYSVPEDDPIHSISETDFTAALQDQLRHCHAVLMLGGIHAARGDWMRREVNLARSFDKPIIGLRPRCGERMSSVVQQAAVEIVGWDTAAIVSAVRQHSQ